MSIQQKMLWLPNRKRKNTACETAVFFCTKCIMQRYSTMLQKGSHPANPKVFADIPGKCHCKVENTVLN